MRRPIKIGAYTDDDICLILELCEENEEENKTAKSLAKRCIKKLADPEFNFRLYSRDRDYLRSKYDSLEDVEFKRLWMAVELRH